MAAAHTSTLLRHIRGLGRPAIALTDRQLLQRFTAERDEAAFAELVDRHGALVLNVCRRTLRREQDAEDAFQAAFLVLARRAASIRKAESIAGWLYGVAWRCARRLQRDLARRRRHEQNVAPSPAVVTEPADPSWREVQEVLHEELARLPEKYRAALVLCYLEGRTQCEAAMQLGWGEEVLRGRVDRGRERLRHRLTRRGITFSAALLATAVLSKVPVSAALVEETARMTTGLVRAPVAALADVISRGLFVARLKLSVLLVAATVAVTAFSYQLAVVSEPVDENPKPAAKSVAEESRPKTDLYGDPLPPGAIARMGTVRFRAGDIVGQIAFTPDSKILAAASHDRRISLWDATTGRELCSIEEATNGSSVAISPDGKTLVSVYGNDLRRWDMNSGKELERFKLKEPVAEHLLFSPDGKSLAMVGRLQSENQNVIVFLDAKTGNELHRKLGQKNYIAPSFAFAPDSKTWAYADSKENAVWLYETATGKEVRQLSGLTKPARAVAFTPDGKSIASVVSGELRFWDLASGKLESKAGRFASPRISFSPDGKFIAGNGIGRRPQLYELAADQNRYPGSFSFSGEQTAIFAPNGRLLAISGGNVIHVWDMIKEKAVAPWEGHQSDVEYLTYAQNGKMLVSAARSSMRYYLWDPATGKELTELEEKHATANSVGLVAPNKASRGSVTAVVASPDGSLLAIGSSGSGTIWLVDAATGKEIRRLDGDKDWIRGLAISADGRMLASQQANAICLWGIATGKKVNSIPSNVPGDNNIALSPDGKTVAQGDYLRGVIHLWDAAKGQELRQWKGHQRGVYGVAFSPDGAKLVSVGDHTEGALVWDVSKGAQLHRLKGHDGYVRFAVFSPDGRSILSGGTDKTIRLWEVASGGERRRFVGHRSDVVCGSFSPDGRQASTGSSDTTALVWDLFGSLKGREATTEQNHLEEVWSALGGTDARSAFRALIAMIAVGDRCLPLLKKHLQPVLEPNAEKLTGLMSKLDSEEFAVRSKAARELEALGDGVRPGLRKLLENPPSEEARRRAEQVLAKLDGSVRLQAVRGVEVLEHIATQEARDLLKNLASGLPEAQLTRQAKAALERLNARSAKK